MGDVTEVSAQSQIVFKERPIADHDAGYSSKAAANAKKRAVENEDQIQSLVKFESGAAGVIKASRICAGRVFGIFWEIAGTEGTIYNSGERFNELQIFRMGEREARSGIQNHLLRLTRAPVFRILWLRFCRRWAWLF